MVGFYLVNPAWMLFSPSQQFPLPNMLLHAIGGLTTVWNSLLTSSDTQTSQLNIISRWDTSVIIKSYTYIIFVLFWWLDSLPGEFGCDARATNAGLEEDFPWFSLFCQAKEPREVWVNLVWWIVDNLFNHEWMTNILRLGIRGCPICCYHFGKNFKKLHLSPDDLFLQQMSSNHLTI